MRISTVLDDAPDRAIVAARPLAPRAVVAEPLRELRVEGLTSRYPGAARGIEDVSFTIVRGQVTIVTGRVGAGKSTLL